MKSLRLLAALMAATSATALAGAAWADPPGRVGRVSDAEGRVSFRPAGEDFWAPVQRNLPVTSGEAFWTDDRSRVELQVAGLEARLDQDSELDVLDLDYGVTRLALPQGSVDLHVWNVPRGGVRIMTPEGEVRIDQPGVYRIDSQPAAYGGDYGPVEVTVFEGVAFAPSDYDPVEVDAGQAVYYLTGYDLDWQDAQTTGLDDWARWRDERQAEMRRRQEEWAEYTGWDDLEGSGDWTEQPEYGRVWFPRVDADWAPYRYGRWSYVQPWGWTWIDDQPWGFAPFHYGRWARFGGRWGWVPGRRDAEPVYSPALVAFVGGGGWGVSISAGGGGALGWIPLGPDEAYVPPYRVSGNYVRRLNSPHVAPTVINNIVINNTVVVNRTTIVYRNAPAATVTTADAMAHGAPVQRARVNVSAQTLAAAPPASGLERITPTREARAGLSFGQPAPGAPNGQGGRPVDLSSAARPPAKLQTVRTAVTTQPPGATHPAATLRPAAPTPSPAPGAAPGVFPGASPGSGQPMRLKPSSGAPTPKPPTLGAPTGAPGGSTPGRPNPPHPQGQGATPPPGPPLGPPPRRDPTPPPPPVNVAPPAPPPAPPPMRRDQRPPINTPPPAPPAPPPPPPRHEQAPEPKPPVYVTHPAPPPPPPPPRRAPEPQAQPQKPPPKSGAKPASDEKPKDGRDKL